ncbi:protein CURVATURE THYLAKOID 1C, chloroplastic [Fagus crenata]
MASTVANLPPPLLLHGGKTLFRPLQKLPVSSIRGFSHIAERQTRVTVIVKATGEGSESSTSLSIVKSVQNVWDKSEDRLALVGLGFAAIVAFWASANVITAIDKLPLIPGVLEFIGILFSSWFTYRYLLFKPDREELFQIINKSISDVLGQ